MTTTSMTGRVANRLRLPGSPAERRLFRGYGPLAGLLLAFLLVALFVPTIAPQKEVIASGLAGGAGAATAGSGATAGSAGSAGSSTAGSAGASSTAAGTAATGSTSPCPGKT